MKEKVIVDIPALRVIVERLRQQSWDSHLKVNAAVGHILGELGHIQLERIKYLKIKHPQENPKAWMKRMNKIIKEETTPKGKR
jgi:hypothetical protein